jgi:hypothetical protein
VRSVDAYPASWYGYSLVGAQRNTQEGRPEVVARTGPNVDRASPASAPGQSRVTARADGSTSLVSRSDLLRLQRTAGNSAVSALVSGTRVPRSMRRPASSTHVMVQRYLEFPVPPGVKQDVLQKELLDYIGTINKGLGLGPDPKIKFNFKPWLGKPRIEVDYTAQQLLDQYPRFLDYLNQGGQVIDKSELFEMAEHKTGVPRVMTELFGSSGDKEASKQNEAAHKALAGQAVLTAEGLDYSSVEQGVRFRAKTNQFAKINDATSSTQGVLQLLKTEEGVIIGENHSEDENRALLIALLPQLKQSNVTTIYLEAVRADYQELVDAYLKGPSAQMHPQLHRFLAGKGDSKDSYLAVLQAIKKEGGLVVKGIDSLPATSRPYGGDTDTRDMARELAMNEYAANTIRGDKGRSKGSKYVILAGRAHSNTQKYRPNTLGMTRGVPGLSQLLDVPAVHVEKGGKVPQWDPEDKWNRYNLPRPLTTPGEPTIETTPPPSSGGDQPEGPVSATPTLPLGTDTQGPESEPGGRPKGSEAVVGSSGIPARAPMGVPVLHPVAPNDALFGFLDSLDRDWNVAPRADAGQGMIVGQGGGVMLGSATKAKEAAPVVGEAALPEPLRFLTNNGSGALCFVYSVVMGVTGRQQSEVNGTVAQIARNAGVEGGWIASDSPAAQRVLAAAEQIFGIQIQVVELQNSISGFIISGRSHNVTRHDRRPVVLRNTGTHYDAIV